MNTQNKQICDGELYEQRFGFKERRANACFYTVLLCMLFAVFSFRVYWQSTFGGVIVDGASMERTLSSGDRLLMKYLKDAEDLQYGDVIVVDVSGYSNSGSRGNYLIKRLIAKEGDKVKFEKGDMYIWYAGTEGYVLLNEPYAYYFNRDGYHCSEYTVGEGEIFFLGDNRNNSCDSRFKEIGGSHLGQLYKVEDIYGVVPDWAIEKQDILEKIFF
jgi:signal peptidase I